MQETETKKSISEIIEEDLKKDLLRLSTAGSVDDGKSTLIGRLLYDSKSIYEDQLAAIEKTSQKRGKDEVDLALLTDGLAAEREQGITIDVAYRYFSTPKRKFIIADTPGHEQYTRNMVTGASTANLAVVMVDARKGFIAQSRRHLSISAMLGIPHIVIAVNKMDLVDFSEDVFNKIVKEFEEFSKDLAIKDIRIVPISALLGQNVVKHNPGEGQNPMPWYKGETLLDILETVNVVDDRNLSDFRLPVQYVLRPDESFRGFAGQIASGVIKKGDEICSLPSGKTSKVKSIVSYGGDLDEAFAPMSVTLTFEDEIDTSRGDILVKLPESLAKNGDGSSAAKMSKDFSANICWMVDEPMQIKKKYLIKSTSNKVKAMITAIDYKTNINDHSKEEASELKLNEIARVQIKLLKPILVDEYSRNRQTGSFIIIDELTNNTVAAGMIVSPN